MTIRSLASVTAALLLASCSKSTKCPIGQGKCTLGNQCTVECTDGCCVLAHPCHTNSDCSGSTPVCDTDGACMAAPTCKTNADCSGSTPACNTSTSSCVACLSTEDCPGLFQACENNQCVATASCTSNAMCSSDAPDCNLFFDKCGQCFADSDCPSSPADQACYDGKCFVGESCTNDASCPTGGVCVPYTIGDDLGWQLLCQKANPDGTLKGGAACPPSTTASCLSGFCGEIGSNDGICLNGCATDSDCAPGAQCPPEGVLFTVLPGPDNEFATNDDVLATAHVCVPASCTNDSQCADAGYDDAPRICGLMNGTISNNTLTADTLSWVVACVPPQGTNRGPIVCASNSDCATGVCLYPTDAGLGECFSACATSGDCADGGTCQPSSIVDESGNAIKTCVE